VAANRAESKLTSQKSRNLSLGLSRGEEPLILEKTGLCEVRKPICCVKSRQRKDREWKGEKTFPSPKGNLQKKDR